MASHILSVLAIITALVSIATGANLEKRGVCPMHYVTGPNNLCFRFYEDRKNWAQAQARCKAEGGQLANTQSGAAYWFVRQHIEANPIKANIAFGLFGEPTIFTLWDNGWWVGAKRWGPFKWIDGQRVQGHWCKQMPDNFLGHEDCLEQMAGNTGWNDRGCHIRLRYICQKKGDPCTGVQCGNGKCVANGAKASCTCNAGWTGSTCNIVVDPCKGLDCGKGKCVADRMIGGSARCACSKGWTGEKCNIVVDPCKVTRINCGNGKCVADKMIGGSVRCACSKGWTGDRCNVVVDPLKVVQFEGGLAKASSKWSEEWRPLFAFHESTKTGWHNAAGSGLPAFIWYEFQTPIAARRVAFQPRQDGCGCTKDQTPTHFQLIGSNDQECSSEGNWTTLCSVENAVPADKVRGCQVEDSGEDYEEKYGGGFRCLGLKISKTSSSYVSLAKIRMWSQPSNTVADLCEKNPCRNGGECASNHRSPFPNYNCRCVGNFKGKNCERSCRFEVTKAGFLAKMDAMILFDGSSSLQAGGGDKNRPKDFLSTLGFISEIVDELDVGPEKSRLELAQFSNKFRVELNFASSVKMDLTALRNKIAAIKYLQGATFTGKALEQAYNIFKSQGRKAEDVAKYLFVVTDGTSHDRKSIPAAVANLKRLGVKLVAVGVGKDVDVGELTLIAGGNAADVFSVDSFDQLNGALIAKVVENICE